jgi:hypothetical protein
MSMRQQYSAAEVINYLMGWPDHYSMHEYTYVDLNSLIKWSRLQKSQKDTAILGVDNRDDLNVRMDVLPDNKVVFVNQTILYIYRPEQLNNLSVYECAAVAYSHKLRENSKNHMPMFPGHPEGVNGYTFSLRTDPVIPTLPFLLVQSEAKMELFAQEFLLLFKPFRSIEDLLGGHNTWLDAYNEFRPSLNNHDTFLSKIVRNLDEMNMGLREKDKLDNLRKHPDFKKG